MPIDRGVIDQQLSALGESQRWWEVREFRDLPAVLHADEQIHALARGKLARFARLRRRWLIVVTDRRLLCLRSSSRTWRQLEVTASQISRVTLRIGPFHARLAISAGGLTHRLLVPRPDGYRLSSTLSSVAPPAHESRSVLRPTLLFRRVFDHVLALPAAALSPEEPDQPRKLPAATAALEERMASLEEELEEMRRHVNFLEQLLQQQHGLPADHAGSATRHST